MSGDERRPDAPQVVVIGDALLDIDAVGVSSRLAPDGPVPVVDLEHERVRPGGAGLAAALASRDGMSVGLITALCDDDASERLKLELGAFGVAVLAIPLVGTTPVKRRIRVADQSLVRVDSGGGRATTDDVDEPMSERIALWLRHADAVLVSDYGRGVSEHRQLRELLTRIAARTPIVWDPHPRGAAPIAGARVVTPNLAEAQRQVGATEPARVWSDIDEWATTLANQWQAGAICITLGHRGALLSRGTGVPEVVPATPQKGDPCGAGDRFAARLATRLACGALVSEAVTDAVRTASAFVAAGGAAHALTNETTEGRWTHADIGTEQAVALVERIRALGGTVVATGGCFDLLHTGHVSVLRSARALGDCLIVMVNGDESVRRLKGPERPLVSEDDRARVLAELASVDAVCIFDEDTPEEIIRLLRPDVWVKGSDYSAEALPEAAVLAEWGGQAVTVPYLPGRSTTALVDAAQRPTDERTSHA